MPTIVHDAAASWLVIAHTRLWFVDEPDDASVSNTRLGASNDLEAKLVVIGAVCAVTLGGIAAALWSASGSGSGRARATTAQSITVDATTGAADLYPGFTGGDLFFTLNNPNPYGVTFSSMSAATITSSDPASCPASNVTVGNATGLKLSVAGGSTSGTLSIPDVVTMASAAPNGCQGVTFDISVTLTGSQT